MGGKNLQCLKLVLDYLRMKSRKNIDKKFNSDEWQLLHTEYCPKQLNNDDGGVFTCVNTEYLARRVKLNFKQSDILKFRHRICYEILINRLLLDLDGSCFWINDLKCPISIDKWYISLIVDNNPLSYAFFGRLRQDSLLHLSFQYFSPRKLIYFSRFCRRKLTFGVRRSLRFFFWSRKAVKNYWWFFFSLQFFPVGDLQTTYLYFYFYYNFNKVFLCKCVFM